jgi:ribonuclease P protein component
MAVHYLKTDEQGCRVGFAASRKTGSAVVRNRLRRRLRESLRILGTEMLPDRHDLVILARPQLGEATLNEAVETLRKALSRLAR